MNSPVVMFVAGDDEAFRGQASIVDRCITYRENPWHAWLRAEDHCLNFKDIPWHVALRAALSCRLAAEALIRDSRPEKL